MRQHFSIWRRRWQALGWLGLFLVGGCSTPFGVSWKRAGGRPVPAGSVEGRWEGTWTSVPTGHRGRLRCLILKTGEGEYSVRYHATFWGVFNYAYRVRMNGVPAGVETAFSGRKNLGWLAGGEYEYSGRADPAHFTATYRSKADHGSFELRRPASP